MLLQKGGKGDEHDIVPSFGVSLFTRPYNTHADGRPLAILPQLALNVDVEDGETVFRPRLEFNVLPGFLPGHSNDFGLNELLDGRYGSHHSAAYNQVPHAAGPYYHQKPRFPGYPVHGAYPPRPYGHPVGHFPHHGHHFDDDFDDEFEDYPGVEYIPGEELPEYHPAPQVVHVENDKGPQLHHHVHLLNGNPTGIPLAGGTYAGQFQHQLGSQDIATQVKGTAIGLAPLPLGSSDGSAGDIQKQLQVIQQLQELNKLQQLQIALQQNSQAQQNSQPQQQYSSSAAQQGIPVNIPITAQLGEGGGFQGISIGRHAQGRSLPNIRESNKSGRVIFPNEHGKLAQARQARTTQESPGRNRRSFVKRGQYGDTEKLKTFRRPKRSAQRYSDAVVVEDPSNRPPPQQQSNPTASETAPINGGVPVAPPANPAPAQTQPNRPWGPIGAIQGVISSLFPQRPPAAPAPENGQLPADQPATAQQPNRPFGFITEAIQSFVPAFNPNPGVGGIGTEAGGGGFGQGGGLGGFGKGKGKGGGAVFNYKPLIFGQTVNHGPAGLGGAGLGPTGGVGNGNNNKGNKGSLKDKFEEKKRKKKNKKKPAEEEEDEYHEPTQYSNFIRPGIGVNLLLKPKYVPLDSHQGVDLLPQVGLGVEYGKGRFKYQPRAHLNVFPAGYFGPYPAHVSKPPPPPPPPHPAPVPIHPPGPTYIGGGVGLPSQGNIHEHIHNYVPGLGLPTQGGLPYSLESQELKQGSDANLPLLSGLGAVPSPQNLDNLSQQLAILQKLQQLKLAEIQSSSSQLSSSDLASLQAAGLLTTSQQSISLTPPVQSSALNPSPLIKQYLSQQSQSQPMASSSLGSQDLAALIRTLQSEQATQPQQSGTAAGNQQATLNSLLSFLQANQQSGINKQRNAFTSTSSFPKPNQQEEQIKGLPAFYFQSYYNGGDAGAGRRYTVPTYRSRFKRQSKSHSRADSASGSSFNSINQFALSQALGVPVTSIPNGLTSTQLQQLQLLGELQKLQSSSPSSSLPAHSSLQQPFQRPSNPLVPLSPGVLNPSDYSLIASQVASAGLSSQNQPGVTQVIPIEQSTNSGTFIGVIKGVFIPKSRSPRLVDPVAPNQVSSQASFSNYVQSNAQSLPVSRPTESVTVINSAYQQQQSQSPLYPSSRPSIEVGPELCRYVACAQLESQCGVSQFARVTNSARQTETRTEVRTRFSDA